MDYQEGLVKGQELVNEFLEGWTVKGEPLFTKTLGRCLYGSRIILIGSYYVRYNDWTEVKGTVLHEIAHALCPGHGHDRVWRAKALEIGSSGEVVHCPEYSSVRNVVSCLSCGRDHKATTAPKNGVRTIFYPCPSCGGREALIYRRKDVCRR
jgi:predicted RNA-binding Zn-ribbon protein involved in translation (DUF1610 family)